jgi:hypothetical protein
MSGMAGAAMPALGAVGMIGSMAGGRMGSAFSMLDPFSAGLMGASRATGVGFGQAGMLSRAGWANFGGGLSRIAGSGIGGIARAGMGAIGGAAAYAAPIMALAAGAKYVGGQMVQGAQFENQVFGQLQNQFRHVNPQARTGFGFSREQAGGIADMLQDMGAKDMMTNAQELRRVMGGTIQMGIMKAVQDVKEFKSRFKKTVGALKEIAETMNTTLEGAMPFFNAARQSGFWTPQDIMRNAGTAKMTAQATGMSVAQVQQMQTQGAQMARSVGALGATGARGMAESLQFVGGAMRGGVVSTPEMAEATGGLTGTQAIGSMAGTLQAATTRFAASRRGRWMLAALGSNNFQQLDPAKLQQFQEGRLSIGQIGAMARRNISQQGAFNFVANERDLRGDLLQRGPQAQLGLIQGVIGKHLYGTSAKSQLITRRLMKRWFGVSGRQADVLTKMAREAPDIQRENEARSAAQMDAQERNREEIMNRSWEGAKRKMSQWWDENVSSPLQKMGADMSRSIGDWWERTTDKFWGRTAAHRRFRGIQGGAIRGMQRAFMGDTRAMETTFGRPGQMQRMFGVGGGAGGGLGMMAGQDTPLTSRGIGWEFAGGGGFAEQFGGGGQGWGKFWGGMANIGLTSVGMGTRTNAAIETARRWGVSETAYKTSAEREAAIAGGGEMRGAFRGGPGAGAYRTMQRSDVDRLRLGMLGATGVLTQRTVGAMGFGGGVKAARTAITGAGEEMGGDIGYRAAAVRASLGDTTGQQQGAALVKQIRAGKIGGEKLRALVSGVSMTQAIQRLAAAQKTGKAGTQIDLSEELERLGVSDLSSERGIVAAEDKQRWGMAWQLAGGAETDPKTGTRYDQYDDFENYKRSAAEDLGNIEKKGGEKYQEALRLMAGNDQEKERGRKMMLALAEDKDTYTDSERKRLARMGDPNDIHAKQIAKAAGKMGLVARGRARAEFTKVMGRRMDRFRESMGKNQEAILDIFNKVKSDRGTKLGDLIRQTMTGSQDPDTIRAKISELTRAASEGDKDQLQRAMRFLSGTKGGEHIVEALRGGLAAQQDIAAWEKGGRGSTRAGVMLARGAGVQVTAEQLKVLRRGGAEAEKLTRKLTKGIDDTTQRQFAERTLTAMQGKMTDEKKQELLKSALGSAGARAAGQLADPKKSLLARQRRMGVEAGHMAGDVGTLKGVHGELTRQTKLLEMIRIGESDPEKALGAKKGGKEGKKNQG